MYVSNISKEKRSLFSTAKVLVVTEFYQEKLFLPNFDHFIDKNAFLLIKTLLINAFVGSKSEYFNFLYIHNEFINTLSVQKIAKLCLLHNVKII